MARKSGPSDKDIFDRALELQQELEEQEASQEARANLAAAAQELGVAPEFLLRAEEELIEEHERQAAQRKKWKHRAFSLVLGLLALGVIASFFYSPPPPLAEGPWAESFDAVVSDWSFTSSPGTQAHGGQVEDDSERGRVAAMVVDRFDPGSAKKGRYFANLRANHPPSTMRGYQTMRLWTRGEGLDTVRIYIRGDSRTRWRSPAIPAGKTWQQHTVPLDSFTFQQRQNKGKKWKVKKSRPMGRVERLQLKVGYFVNEADAKGVLFIDDLEFLQ
ncbi:MAG: hypothetical protein VX498_11605 [Myxococcota bacterium]|nr:hypothetical protein [Myxococcota bacterium]